MGDLEELVQDPDAWLAERRRQVLARVQELLFDDDEEEDVDDG